MSNDAITVGSKTTTGGVVISGNSGVVVNNQPVALVGDIATCMCGSKSCRGKGPIVATSPRNIVVNGISFAKAGDLVDTGCGNCYLAPSFNQVTLGASSSPISMGGGVSIGNGVNVNIGGGVSFGSMGNVSIEKQANTGIPKNAPQIDPNHAYWPPYNPLAKDGEKTLKVDYVTPITTIAWMSPEEAHEFLQNLYEDIGANQYLQQLNEDIDVAKESLQNVYEDVGGKETSGHLKDYGQGLGKGIYDTVKTVKGLGGFGVKAYTKNINGQDWIIIKNYHKHLKTLERGNKWKANNPRIIQLGLGLNDLKGAVRYVRFNVGLEVAVSVGINAVDYALRDEATLAEFVGNSAGDIVKGLTALGSAALITTAFVPATASVLLSGTVFVVMSFIAGKGLDGLDKRNGYSKEITKAVVEYYNDYN
ncbi:PAAR domain-containing protein [Vibrio sp. OPT18]|uniref:PAAR domain-containing protein n=1 Tax=Vibrio sp. OPT18 TaxID=2778641 RepID=UPI0018814C37|nr:PAAR domain-containing protein [Vibrio sp. OPT18]MBE8577869.1 PAAR domain-containing protein [Vibrio sp. OPT18]